MFREGASSQLLNVLNYAIPRFKHIYIVYLCCSFIQLYASTYLSNSQGNAKAGMLAIVFSSRKFSGKLSVITPSGVEEYALL